MSNIISNSKLEIHLSIGPKVLLMASNPLRLLLSAWYPDLDYTGISMKKLFAAYNQPASQPGTLAFEMLPLFIDPTDIPGSFPSMEIIEKGQNLIRADPKGVWENAPDPAPNPSSPPVTFGPKGPSMTSVNILPIS